MADPLADKVEGAVEGVLPEADKVGDCDGRGTADTFSAVNEDTFLEADFGAKNIQDFCSFGEDFGAGLVSYFEVPVAEGLGEVVGTLGGNQVDYSIDFVVSERLQVACDETVWLANRRCRDPERFR